MKEEKKNTKIEEGVEGEGDSYGREGKQEQRQGVQ